MFLLRVDARYNDLEGFAQEIYHFAMLCFCVCENL